MRAATASVQEEVANQPSEAGVVSDAVPIEACEGPMRARQPTFSERMKAYKEHAAVWCGSMVFCCNCGAVPRGQPQAAWLSSRCEGPAEVSSWSLSAVALLRALDTVPTAYTKRCEEMRHALCVEPPSTLG